MDGGNEAGYKPSPEFKEDGNKPLVDLKLTDSTELCLIRWPVNQPPDFHGKELSLKLHREGQLSSFEVSSVYDVVSCAAQEPDATVFLSSASESKIIGKISRQVSIVQYPEPDESVKLNSNNLRQMYQEFNGTSLTNYFHCLASRTQSNCLGILQSSSVGTPQCSSMENSRSSSLRNSQLAWEHSAFAQSNSLRSSQLAQVDSAFARSSRSKSSLSEEGEASKPQKRKRVAEPCETSSVCMERSTVESESSVTSSVCLDSGRGHTHSTATSSRSQEHSHQRKSNKKLKMEE